MPTRPRPWFRPGPASRRPSPAARCRSTATRGRKTTAVPPTLSTASSTIETGGRQGVGTNAGGRPDGVRLPHLHAPVQTVGTRSPLVSASLPLLHRRRAILPRRFRLGPVRDAVLRYHQKQVRCLHVQTSGGPLYVFGGVRPKITCGLRRSLYLHGRRRRAKKHQGPAPLPPETTIVPLLSRTAPLAVHRGRESSSPKKSPRRCSHLRVKPGFLWRIRGRKENYCVNIQRKRDPKTASDRFPKLMTDAGA